MKPATTKLSKLPSLFLFRCAITGQVVPSKTQVLKYEDVFVNLKSPPHAIRKDHWRPIAVVNGFEHSRTAEIVWHSLFTYPNPLPGENYMKTPIRLRKRDEKEQALHKISALCRILSDLPNHKEDSKVFPKPLTQELKLNILWETPYFKNIVEQEGLKWPEFVNHGVLDLIRGRNIANPEYNNTHSGRERFIALHEKHTLRHEAKAKNIEQ